MKSVFTRSATGRRAAAGTVLALAATSLSLGLAGPASATQSLELQGTVTGAAGVPLAGIEVVLYDATTGDPFDGVLTDVAGHYEFDNDFAGSVKVAFYPDSPTVTANSPLPYQMRWSGGSRYQAGATVTATTVDPATAPVVNASLPQYAAITGNVTVGNGHVATDDFGTWAQNTDENYVGDTELTGSPFVDGATGNYRMIVDPSSPVRVAAWGTDTDTEYLDQYWMNADTLASATPINVAPGQTVGGVNFRLTNALTARSAPSIAGHPTVGLPLTVSPGTWSRNAGTEFSYKWMRGATVVGTGASYVPTAADFGQKLAVVVTALNGENTGQSTTVTSEVVKYGATEKVKAKGKAGRKVALAIKLVSAKQSPVKGKVVVMRGTKVVHKAVKLVKGKAAIVLKNQPKGRQTYTLHYKGNSTLAQVDKTFTVRVHK